jgi:hypothetical protein
MKGHYLLIVLPDGESKVERIYWPLASVEETADAALTRWVEHELRDRKTRGKLYDAAEQAVRGRVLYVRITRPTSWYDAARERGDLPRLGRARRRAAGA